MKRPENKCINCSLRRTRCRFGRGGFAENPQAVEGDMNKEKTVVRNETKNERLISNVFLLLWFTIGISSLWETLEMIYYGEIQTRKVDTIIALVYMALLVLSYWRGRIHGLEDGRNGE